MSNLRKAAVVIAGAALAMTPTSASAADNPAQKCAMYNDLDLTRGACASTLAQNPGVDLDDPEAVFTPSRAAFIANCKALETNGPDGFGFLVYDEDGDVVSGPYPHQFYKGMLDDVHVVMAVFQLPEPLAGQVVTAYKTNKHLFTAKNRAGCVRVLQGLHSGELFGLLFPTGP